MSKTPKCMFCRHEPAKPVKKGTRFCSQNCAAYAHEIVNTLDSGWYLKCNSWQDEGTHPDFCDWELIRPKDKNA